MWRGARTATELAEVYAHGHAASAPPAFEATQIRDFLIRYTHGNVMIPLDETVKNVYIFHVLQCARILGRSKCETDEKSVLIPLADRIHYVVGGEISAGK